MCCVDHYHGLRCMPPQERAWSSSCPGFFGTMKAWHATFPGTTESLSLASLNCISWLQVAEQQGRYLAQTFNNGEAASPTKPFTWKQLGAMATIGTSALIPRISPRKTPPQRPTPTFPWFRFHCYPSITLPASCLAQSHFADLTIGVNCIDNFRYIDFLFVSR